MTRPVIIDTDIGTDIDDTWALAMALKSPEIDLKLVSVCSGDTEFRARVAARFLDVCGRADVAVAVGQETSIPLWERLKRNRNPQLGWVRDYAIDDYPGEIRADAAAAMIEVVMASDEPVDLIAIGPLTNVAAALVREPRIAQRCRFIGMHGSLRRGYNDAPGPVLEYNVAVDIPACQMALHADWPVVVTPLDSCAQVVLRERPFSRVRACSDPAIAALFENYEVWLDAWALPDHWLRTRSSVLFDTVAVYLSYDDALLVMEDLPVTVDDAGRTRIDPEGKVMRVATGWRDLGGFCEHLSDRLCGDLIVPA